MIKPLLILYAGESGNAQETAEMLYSDARYRCIPVLLRDFSEYNVQVSDAFLKVNS